MSISEKLMVCVHYGPHGERLIRRGAELASLLRCPLFVLSVLPVPEEELDPNQERWLQQWRTICKEVNATFMAKSSGNAKPSEIIVETSQSLHITQLLIGQSGQTRWQEITKGSFVNELLNRIGQIDVHIVAVQRLDQPLTSTHERGISVNIIKKEGLYFLSTEESEGKSVASGIFFKDLNTDFDNGLLKLKINGQPRYLKVSRGEVLHFPSDL
jgi:two-component system sensor histidine kinase KdpD